MLDNGKTKRDPFAFSLRGVSSLAPFMPPIVIADDRLSKTSQRTDATQNERDNEWRPAEQPGC